MLEQIFRLQTHKTDVKTEIIAGIATFMSMSYILVINPSILVLAGMDTFAVFTATALSAIITTLAMAFLANKPIALAPGMDLNILFVTLVVGQMGYSWQFAITACFIAGIIFFILSLTGFGNASFKCFPPSLRNALSVGVGMFITSVALRSSGIIVDDPITLIQLGNIFSAPSFVSIAGVIIMSLMFMYKIKGALLLGILISTMIGIPLGISSFDTVVTTPHLFSIPSIAPTFMKFEWNHVFSFDMLNVVIFFLFVDMFGTTGTVTALGTKGKWFDDDGTLPEAKKIFCVDAFGTVLASVLGSSPATSYIESSTGIVEGGKTGLTSFTVAILFIFSLFFAPIFLLVPIQASSAALIMVGIFMITPVASIDFTDYLQGVPAFITIIMMPLTSTIHEGLILGLTCYVVLALLSGRGKEVSPLAFVIVTLAMGKYVFIG